MRTENNISTFEMQYIEDELKINKGLKKKIYFDSYDVISMVQGVWHFNKDYHFKFEKFKPQTNLIVHGIASKGWLDKISMLKPHQDEFIYKLTKNDIDFPKNIIFSKNDIESDFLYNLGIKKVDFIKDLDSEQFKNYVLDLKINSLLIFKSDFILYPFHWLNRYKKYFEEDKTIELSFEQINVQILMKSDIFKIIKQKLEKRRPFRSFNNFMDSLAIAQLQLLVDKFNSSNFKESLPLFYSGNETLQTVLKEIHEEHSNLLSYPHPDKKDKQIPIYRFERFFIIDPLFNLNEGEFLYQAIEEFNILKTNLKSLIKTHYNSSESASLEASIAESIGKEVDLEFFSKIWLKGGYEEFHESIIKYLNYYDKYDKKIEELISHEKELIKSKFLKDIEFNSLLYLVVSQIRNIKEETKKLNHEFNNNIDPFTEFGLTRFCFSQNVCKSISDLINILFENLYDNKVYLEINKTENSLNKQIEEDIDNAITKIIDYLIRGSTDKDNFMEFNIGLAILWIYGKYEVIVKLSKYFIANSMLLSFLPPDELNSFYSIYASSLVYSDKEESKTVLEILDYHKNLGIKDFRYNLTRSFVLFQLWNFYVRKLAIPELANESQKKAIICEKDIHNEILKLLEDAILMLEKMDFYKKPYYRRKYYYIINNYIYYCTKGAHFKKFNSKKLEGYYEEIITLKNDNNVWQNRFFDTLGWFDFRKAVHYYRLNDYDKTAQYINRAKKNNKYSLNGPILERDKINYYHLKDCIEQFINSISHS